MKNLLQDIRYALRILRKSPGFTAVAIITLALGIGANTAIFSLINAIMLRTLPVKDAQRLVSFRWAARSTPAGTGGYHWSACPMEASSEGSLYQGCTFSYPMFDLIRSEQNVFSSVTAFMQADTTVNSDHHSSKGHGLYVSGEFFSTLGGRIAMGRGLTTADDSSAVSPAVVVSYQLWRSELHADPAAIGKSIAVGQGRFTVVGVSAPEFAQLDLGVPVDFWLPLAFQPAADPNMPKQNEPASVWLGIMARLKPGVSASQANAAVNTIFVSAAISGPMAIFKPSDSPRLELPTTVHGLGSLREHFLQPLGAMLIAVAIVLLIACANIAGLALARSSARRKEIATRSALGATRARIIRQLLTESILLSIAGGGVGIVLGYWGAHFIAEFLSANWYSPLAVDVHPDPHVFGFTLLVSAIVGVLFGLAPAFSSGRLDLVTALKNTSAGSMGTSRGRRLTLGNGLVVAQMTLAMMVLASAGLLVRTLANLRAVTIGFEPKNVLLFDVDATYSGRNEEDLRRLGPDLQRQFAPVPGVTSASYSSFPLMRQESMVYSINKIGPAKLSGDANMLPVATDFFRTMGIPLLAGRSLSVQESQSQQPMGGYRAAVVNESFSRRFFGARSPLGQNFQFGSDKAKTEIVGVVGDARYDRLRNDVQPTVYTPITHLPKFGRVGTFEVRTALDPKAMMPAIRAAVNRFDPNLLITDMKTQEEQIDQNIYQERLIANLSSLFALLALIVACVGIYGLLSYQVTRRTQEIGIRLALGAQRGDVLGIVLRQGAILAALGTLLGAGAALALTRYLQSFLFGVKPSDPLTIFAVSILLITVALLASYLPARRAMQTDPMVALRYE